MAQMWFQLSDKAGQQVKVIYPWCSISKGRNKTKQKKKKPSPKPKTNKIKQPKNQNPNQKFPQNKEDSFRPLNVI